MGGQASINFPLFRIKTVRQFPWEGVTPWGASKEKTDILESAAALLQFSPVTHNRLFFSVF